MNVRHVIVDKTALMIWAECSNDKVVKEENFATING